MHPSVAGKYAPQGKPHPGLENYVDKILEWNNKVEADNGDEPSHINYSPINPRYTKDGNLIVINEKDIIF